ncbi:RNA-binding domain-containing protein [Sanyastnella coralliicola]|uniref:RNA-binding domain-containing protein n=1 Tax=Sanyastnella coralliicola TaxID=3069118 RepID=UPI0027B9822C|nr:RNA-binding domain-containing protein [Longitalea sp. SCSIO 12813]
MQKLERSAFDQAIEASVLNVLSEEKRSDLYEIHEVWTLSRNEEVFKSHQEGKRLFVVSKGCFKLFLKNGKVKTLKTGQLFGEVAALTENERLGSATGGDDISQVITFEKSKLESQGLIPSDSNPSLLRLLFQNTVNYLHELLDNSTETLIQRGEDEQLEFKEGGHNPNIIKSIAAFLNTQGGTLLIGVNDAGEVIGVPDYSNQAADKYDQDFQNLIREKLGTDAMPFVHFCHSCFEGKGVYRIDVVPSDRPIYAFTGKGTSGESFFIRSGSTNQQLGFGAALHYIARRFPAELLRVNG